jgi:hypothetical protein
VLVLPHDPQRHLLRDEPALVPSRWLEVDLLPTAQPIALRPLRAIHAHAVVDEQTFGRRARADFGKRCEEPVEPLAGRCVRNA